MKNDIEFPETLAAAIKYFADADTALNFMASVRWPDGKVVCPCCHKSDAGFLATRKIWKCRECGKQFSVKVGTIFEDSALGFDKWLPAFWMIVNAKNGISSCELGPRFGRHPKDRLVHASSYPARHAKRQHGKTFWRS